MTIKSRAFVGIYPKTTSYFNLKFDRLIRPLTEIFTYLFNRFLTAIKINEKKFSNYGIISKISPL